LPVERPTFHESWYRVSDLHPRLRNTVQISRQHFRGQPWHVVQDHSNNAFFRLAEPAYRFVALLDGKRSVGDAWNLANEQLGDEAPTQGEAIQLLGQLYVSNLLMAEVPADTHTLFARYKKRKQREIASYFMNIMFMRLPIFDPDRFLNKWLPLLGWIFSPVGLVVWVVLLVLGISAVGQYPGWADKIRSPASGLLSPDNLVLLYVAFAVIKACHEMGHAIACKKFGKQSGSGGEVHIIGIMFLVFTPIPYVDASSSWALTNKWHRAIVGAAGMWVELAIASIAAMAWANTSEGAALHNFAYNVMFVAGFSTLAFNANPLLRYDGYYILSDLMEIPNLSQRAKDYLYYLVKRYVWNVRQARNPAYGGSEKFWMFVYAIASFIMRIVVTLSIMFYLTAVLDGVLIILATGMAIAGMITWAVLPVTKYIHYLATDQELHRVRGRAVLTSLLAAAVVVVTVGVIQFPDRARAQGVVEPDTDSAKEIYGEGDGLVLVVNPEPHAGEGLDAIARRLAMPYALEGETLLAVDDHNVQRQIAENSTAREHWAIRLRAALLQNDLGAVEEAQWRLELLDETKRMLEQQRERLTVKAPLSGVFVSPDLRNKRAAYVKRSDVLGLVADLHHLIIRTAVTNDLAATLDSALKTDPSKRHVEIRIEGRPDVLLTGDIFAYAAAGTKQLPSAALGYQVGGALNTAPGDQHGTKTTESFFEVRIGDLKLQAAPKEIAEDFKDTTDLPLLPGQRVMVRFELPAKPLALQAWKKLTQVFQKRFQL
jgi:putative peptide zinc metalloprotease protein